MELTRTHILNVCTIMSRGNMLDYRRRFDGRCRRRLIFRRLSRAPKSNGIDLIGKNKSVEGLHNWRTLIRA